MTAGFVAKEARRLAVVGVVGLLGGAAFVALVPRSAGATELPTEPGLRLSLVALAVMCFLLALSLVRHIPDAPARIAGSTALVLAGLWFAFDVAGLARLAAADEGLGTWSRSEILEGAALLAVGLGMIVVSLRLVRSRGMARGPR
jgi:hypothetical protein